MKNIILTFFAIFFLFSCSEKTDITEQVNEYQNGGFARFDGPVVTTATVASGKYSANIIDINNNIVSYKITKISGKIGATTYAPKDTNYSFTLPAKVEIPFSDLVTLFGSQPISAGDTFVMIAEVTTNDGRVFTGIAPSVTNNVNTGGNTPANLISTATGANFFSAMRIGFTVN